MTTALSILGLLLGLALIWSGHRRLQWYSASKAVLSALDLLTLALAVYSLGWSGVALLAAANLFALLAWGAASAIYMQAEMSAAAALSEQNPSELRQTYEAVTKIRDLRSMGGRRSARMVRLLAERGRQPEEILVIAHAVGLLWIITTRPIWTGSLNGWTRRSGCRRNRPVRRRGSRTWSPTRRAIRRPRSAR